MMKKVLAVLLLVAALQHGAGAADAGFQVTFVYEADDKGAILQRIPYGGWIVFYADGTYKMQLHVYDEGTFQLAPASPQQPNNVIYFLSKKGYRLYGLPGADGKTLAVWLYKTPKGTDVWVNAVASADVPGLTPRTAAGQQSPAGGQGQGQQSPAGGQGRPQAPAAGTELVRNGLFTETVMYGTTSAPQYYWYDRGTGGYAHDQKGIIFQPAGTYYLKAEFGGLLQEERGNYRIDGNVVTLQFSDGSALRLTIEQGGTKLHWYDKGILLAEFFFLGVAK